VQPVRRREQIDRMLDAHTQPAQDRAGPDLEDAARVGRRNHLRSRRRDAVELPLEEAARHPGLGQVVRTRAAAAHLRLFELDQTDTRDGGEQLPDLRAHALAVREVTRVVHGNGAGERARRRG